MRTLLRSQLFLVSLWVTVMATLPYTTYKLLMLQREAPALLAEHVTALVVGNIVMTAILILMMLLVTAAHWQLRQRSVSRVRDERPSLGRPSPSRPKPSPRTSKSSDATPASTGLQLVEVGAESPLQSRLPMGAIVVSVNGKSAMSLEAAESVLKPGVNEIDWVDDTGKRNMAYVMVRDGKLHAQFRPV